MINYMEIAPIQFCDKYASNVRNPDFKSYILKELFDKYQIVVTDNSCSIYKKHHSKLLLKSSYVVSMNTTGNRYFLYLCKNEFNERFCYFVDRKICRGYVYPRVIYTKFKFDKDVFNGTLLEGELVYDINGIWYFMITDIHSFCGRKVGKSNFINRLKMLYDLLENHYIQDELLDVCKLRVKKFYDYSQMKTLIDNIIPKQNFQVNGIYFTSIYPNKNNILVLNNFKTNYKIKNKKIIRKNYNNNNNKKEDIKSINSTHSSNVILDKPDIIIKKPQIVQSPKVSHQKDVVLNDSNKNNKNDDKICTFIIRRTEQGIYELISFVNKNKKVFGYARIDKLKTQKKLQKYLNQHKEQDVLYDCKYSEKFQKFIPVEPSTNTEPSQYIDVQNKISN